MFLKLFVDIVDDGDGYDDDEISRSDDDKNQIWWCCDDDNSKSDDIDDDDDDETQLHLVSMKCVRFCMTKDDQLLI